MDKCQFLHTILEQLPLIKYPFDLEELSLNGIYFFYERGEYWGHQNNKPRIVRIGTHKRNNFRSRISEHYLFNEKKMGFGKNNQKPSDRSIFRKNIGRALLNQTQEKYLDIWEIDFTIKENRKNYGHMRDIQKEKKIEYKITRIMRDDFLFRFIVIHEEEKRIGESGLEKPLTGTFSQCRLCKPSDRWLGNHSPVEKIRDSGLWQVQHLNQRSVSSIELDEIRAAVE